MVIFSMLKIDSFSFGTFYGHPVLFPGLRVGCYSCPAHLRAEATHVVTDAEAGGVHARHPRHVVLCQEGVLQGFYKVEVLSKR